MKLCRRCKTEQPFDQFTTDRSMEDGRDKYCRGCRREIHAAWRARNREKAGQYREQARERMTPEQLAEYRKRRADQAMDRYWKDPEQFRARSLRWAKENPEKAAASTRRNYARHREAILERVAERLAANPERQARVRAYKAEWARLNPEKRLASSMRRRAALANVPNELIDRRDVFERDSYLCWICHEPTIIKCPEHRFRPSIDHVVPLCEGGPHIMDNLRCAHVGCNVRRHLLEYRWKDHVRASPPTNKVVGDYARAV